MFLALSLLLLFSLLFSALLRARALSRLALQLLPHQHKVAAQIELIEPDALSQPSNVFVGKRAVAHLRDNWQQPP